MLSYGVIKYQCIKFVEGEMAQFILPKVSHDYVYGMREYKVLGSTKIIS